MSLFFSMQQTNSSQPTKEQKSREASTKVDILDIFRDFSDR
ncbi:hypothetical protein C2W64_01827 [Brevibacillus laterosporus]|nr:hypothetical protein C2W64_01827 [Brevibacillus laterosporus]